jgi:chromosome segregation ATPase
MDFGLWSKIGSQIGLFEVKSKEYERYMEEFERYEAEMSDLEDERDNLMETIEDELLEDIRKDEQRVKHKCLECGHGLHEQLKNAEEIRKREDAVGEQMDNDPRSKEIDKKIEYAKKKMQEADDKLDSLYHEIEKLEREIDNKLDDLEIHGVEWRFSSTLH